VDELVGVVVAVVLVAVVVVAVVVVAVARVAPSTETVGKSVAMASIRAFKKETGVDEEAIREMVSRE